MDGSGVASVINHKSKLNPGHFTVVYAEVVLLALLGR